MQTLAFLTPEHQAYLLAIALLIPFLIASYWLAGRGGDELSEAKTSPTDPIQKTPTPNATPQPPEQPATSPQPTPSAKKPPANKSKKKKKKH